MDLGGIPCDYDRIYQAVEGKKALFCPKGDVQEALGRVAVVADCAHGLGASRHGVPTGALADFTSFSFPRREELHHRRGRCIGVAHAAGS